MNADNVQGRDTASDNVSFPRQYVGVMVEAGLTFLYRSNLRLNLIVLAIGRAVTY